jgi:hypothetical protein
VRQRIDIVKLRDLKEKLWKTPMFHMMLGGRELFHSNFLGWIFENHTATIANFFGLSHGIVRVQREKHNLDLIVTCGEMAIFIENKFKAIISEEQLVKYSDKISENAEFKKAKKNLIILSPDEFDTAKKFAGDLQKYAPYGSQRLDKKWYHLSYRDLLKHLENAENNYIRDYVAMTSMALDFMEGVMINDRQNRRFSWFDPQSEFKEQDALAQELKLQDMLQKRRAEILQGELWSSIKEQGSLGIQRKDVRSDFSRTEPLAEAFMHLNDQLSMGIQIQGDKYKRCLLIKRELVKKGQYDQQTVNELREKKSELLRRRWFRTEEERIFFGNSISDNGLNSGPQKQKHFQKYGDNFYYQYVKLGVDRQSPSKLVETVLKDLEFAKTLA